MCGWGLERYPSPKALTDSTELGTRHLVQQGLPHFLVPARWALPPAGLKHPEHDPVLSLLPIPGSGTWLRSHSQCSRQALWVQTWTSPSLGSAETRSSLLIICQCPAGRHSRASGKSSATENHSKSGYTWRLLSWLVGTDDQQRGYPQGTGEEAIRRDMIQSSNPDSATCCVSQ